MSEFREVMDAYKTAEQAYYDVALTAGNSGARLEHAESTLEEKIEILKEVTINRYNYCDFATLSAQPWFDQFMTNWTDPANTFPQLGVPQISVSMYKHLIPDEAWPFLAENLYNWIANPTYDPKDVNW